MFLTIYGWLTRLSKCEINCTLLKVTTYKYYQCVDYEELS